MGFVNNILPLPKTPTNFILNLISFFRYPEISCYLIEEGSDEKRTKEKTFRFD